MTKDDHILFLQVTISQYLMKRWKINEEAFVKLDEQFKILWYIRLCYEPFHLTGDEGIAEEVEQYIQDQGGKI